MDKQIILTKEQRERCSDGKSFIGRMEGEKVREELALNLKDYDEYRYVIMMPEDTMSFAPSFYLGLLYNSVKNIGWDKFAQKYRFNLDKIADSMRGGIRAELDKSEREAKKELYK